MKTITFNIEEKQSQYLQRKAEEGYVKGALVRKALNAFIEANP